MSSRRRFIRLLAGAAAWPFVARAQQGERTRRIVVLASGTVEGDRQERNTAFVQGLQNVGWTVGRNVQIDFRTGSGSFDAILRHAAEIVALAPDVIVTSGDGVEPVLQATKTIPVVFVNAVDPVGGGLVKSLSKPGGNATGFLSFEYDLSGKWLELLKQIVPSVTRAAVLRDPGVTAGIGQFAVIQSVARSVGVEVSPINVRDISGVESAVADFAHSPNGGLVVTSSALAAAQRKLIISLAARHKLPAVYSNQSFVAAGGLISYGPDFVDQYRQAAGYVDRVLKGEKPADLPVQAPTKYELVINLSTAKALGLAVPPSLLARADEVIQ